MVQNLHGPNVALSGDYEVLHYMESPLYTWSTFPSQYGILNTTLRPDVISYFLCYIYL
jgi:hypothetical protein